MTRKRLRLSTVLILINLVILALPLGGIAVLRIYESALVRQTESELIAQGAFIAASYRAAFTRLATDARLRPKPGYGRPVTSPPRPADPDNRWRPRFAVLDLANDPVLPPPPEPLPAIAPADTLAAAIGRELAPVLQDAQQLTLAGLRVTDARGVVVATTGSDLGASLQDLDEVQRALSGEYVSAMRLRGSSHPPPALESISRGARIRVWVAIPIVRDKRVLGSVLLARTPADIRDTLYGKRHALVRGAAVLLVVVIAIALLTSLTINRPVQALIAQARRAARGDTAALAPLARPGTREIAELSETVTAMGQSLAARANYIRDFAAHVSHEFKTPLTAIQGTVELLRDHGSEMSDAERRKFLDILERDARRLEELVRRLLELARAESVAQPGARCDAAAVARAAVERQRAAGLDVAVQAPARALPAAIGADALDSILTALLDNVRKHAGAAAATRLECRAADRAVEIELSDDGPGVSAANAARVFEPFFTTARERGGTGMGLSIARALLRAHGGDLVLVPGGRGARFQLQVPAP